MKQVTAIVLAAGKGLRLKSKISKPLIKIDSKPGIIYCLAALSRHPDIKDIIVVVNSINAGEIIKRIRGYRIKKIKNVVKGGKERRDSVLNGLRAMSLKAELVLIHDGVRPFINKNMITAVINEAARYGAAVTGVPVKATIKKLQAPGSKLQAPIIEKTLDRNNLWEIQTPQAFRKDLLVRAYKKYARLSVTDDAALVEKLGVPVRVVRGAYSNIKITTPEDLIIAEAIVKNSKF
jgi:2-C-methyl-D-erythritol 4-phosphate cytidylyltransferase